MRTTTKPNLPLHGLQEEYTAEMNHRLYNYTVQMLDRYGAGNLPIVERELKIKYTELMQEFEMLLQAYELKKPLPVSGNRCPLKRSRVRQRTAAYKAVETTGDHPP